MQFKEFPKMARLSRECYILEKIDGTNASIFIQSKTLEQDDHPASVIATIGNYTIRAGSRTRWINTSDDNYGFAAWVKRHAEELVALGEGHHFGEWWGQGIQRGYGLKEKRFSLFNVARWDSEGRPACCHVVPTLYKFNFDTFHHIDVALSNLKQYGSSAAPGFMNPEGIVVYHVAGNVGFKKTIEKDELPKSQIKKDG